MGLDRPDLDDREYEEFVADARKQIPVLDEAWTDHNAHDPGITFLELLAWVAETETYQLDRLADRHRDAYLRLMGVEPEPPRPARGHLALSVPESHEGALVEAGDELAAHLGPNDAERFRARQGLALTAADVDAVVSVHRGGQTDETVANRTDGMYYRAFGDEPSAGDALYLGFDADPFAVADRLDITVGFHDADLPPRASHGDENPEFVPSHRVAWEYYRPDDSGGNDGGGDGGDDDGATDEGDGNGDDTPEDDGAEDGSGSNDGNGDGDGGGSGTDAGPVYGEWYDDDRWQEFAVTRDETTQLYGGGRVTLAAPTPWPGAVGSVPGLDVDGEYVWIRARLARRERPERTGPPPCDAPAEPPPPPVQYEVPPQVRSVETNVLAVEHCATETDEQLERRDGPLTTAGADQTFHFENDPVQEATVTVGGDVWTAVPDFARSGPDDRHYVLDSAGGAVRFGDGLQGAVPDPGQVVRAKRYVYGGGPAGNVPGDAEWSFDQSGLGGVTVRDQRSVDGGTGAESLDEAFERLEADRRTPYRAVTREDYATVATHTPGLRFGRAAVRPPDDPSGAVRVVVVPYSPPDVRPVPSEGFLDAVDCHLKRHSLLTDDVTAVAPTYAGVDVAADVRIAEGRVRAERRRAAIDAIEAFLDPLRGFDGDGWPFGRPVYPSEVYELLEETDGIETVTDVSVDAGGVDFDASDVALPYPETVTVVVEDRPDTCNRRT